MKTVIEKIVISAAMALLIVFFATQAVSAQEPYWLVGHVYNSTGAPVPAGVTVYINDTTRMGGPYVITAVTDAGGKYKKDINIIANITDGDVFICSASYMDESGSCSFVLGRNLNLSQQCDIHLEAVIVPEEPSVTVRYPNGGESIVQGTSVQVSADATDDEEVVSVEFSYSPDEGTTWVPIVEPGSIVSGNTWNATWDTTGLTPGNQYLINATATDSDGLTDTDTSDATFSIIALETIEVSPASKTLVEGEEQLFTATAKDQYGNPMADISITWTSSNPTVGTVSPKYAITDSDGNATTTFTALTVGTTTIKAENGTVNGTAAVTVIFYGVELTVNTTAQVVAPDVNATYLLTVKNIGAETDDYTLSYTNPQNAIVSLSKTEITNLPVGGEEPVFLYVKSASKGTFHVNVTATSAYGPTDYVNTTTTVPAVAITAFEIRNPSADRGQNFTARLNLTTTDDATPGWYVVVVSGTEPGGEYIAGIGTVYLTSDSGVDNMPVLVHIPPLAAVGDYSLIATVHTLAEYPEGLITHEGPRTATVVS